MIEFTEDQVQILVVLGLLFVGALVYLMMSDQIEASRQLERDVKEEEERARLDKLRRESQVYAVERMKRRLSQEKWDHFMQRQAEVIQFPMPKESDGE